MKRIRGDSADYASLGPLFASNDEQLPELAPLNPEESYLKKLSRAQELHRYVCPTCNEPLGNCPACENRKAELHRLAEDLNINIDTLH